MELPFKKEINTELETNSVAEEFAKIISEGDVICLNGNLGAGKTYFVKQIAAIFGIKNASSPTFAIVNEYTGRKKNLPF